MNKHILTVIVLVVAAAFSRLIPHPWNFTAIGAMALFGGTYLPSKKLSLIAPIVALLLSDLVLGFHGTMVFVYGAFILNVILGWTLTENRGIFRLTGVSLLSSLLFFLITNFGVWMMEPYYAKTFAGLVQCFVMAIPFFDNQILGDLFYVALMFGSFEALKRFVPELSYSTK